jgi:hypothetical protein
MKKFAMAAVAAAALSAGVAQAYTVGTFSNGLVVPNVIHNGPTDTTAVGLINQSGGTRAIYWTFFDQDSNHVTDGCFTMTNKDYEPFVWSGQSGGGLAGVRGYLVFTVGADPTTGLPQTACAGNAVLAAMDVGAPGSTIGTQLAANAFQVNVTAADVAFIPVIDGPLLLDAPTTDVTTMGPNSLVAVSGAAQVAPGPGALTQFSMRYAIDQAPGGTDTAVVVWSTGSQKGTHTVNIYDNAQNRKSVNFTLTKAELDWFDPESILGLPATHKDGFIEWAPNAGLTAPTGAPAAGSLFVSGGSVFTYSVIAAPAFGAVQSVLGAHRL